MGKGAPKKPRVSRAMPVGTPSTLLGETDETINGAFLRMLEHLENPRVRVHKHGAQLMLQRAVINGFCLTDEVLTRAATLGLDPTPPAAAAAEPSAA